MFDSKSPEVAGITLSDLTDEERELGNALDLQREESGAARERFAPDGDGRTDVTGFMSSTSYESIHHATCMLEYLGEVESAGAESDGMTLSENQRYGRWLIQETITRLLRRGLQQQLEEERQASQ